jgi:secreted PhoX family phosphatase
MSAYGDDNENVGTNPSTQTHIGTLVEARLSRRNVLLGGMATAVGFMSSSVLTAAPAAAAGQGPEAKGPRAGAALLGYTAIPLGYGDDVAVPPGYTAQPFLPWGTPILGAFPAFRPGANTAAEQEQQVGMHHDGMHFFATGGSTGGLLVVNHEYTDERLLHTGSQTDTRPSRAAITADQVRKSQAAHGVSVVEIARDSAGAWKVVPSRRNRRVTANTPMRFAGPAAGHRLLQTAVDPTGTRPVGTINNCAHGFTPWSTYLTCEENFNGYFATKTDGGYTAEQTAVNRRYGVGGDNYYWAERDPRFALTGDNPQEVNRFGWVVEIDPNSPVSTPVKRTALGRLKHEGAFVHVTKGQRVVVYMGDDQVNEHAYKFVSSDNWTPCSPAARTRSTTGRCTSRSSTTTALVSGCRWCTASRGSPPRRASRTRETYWSRRGWRPPASARPRCTGRSGPRWTRTPARST